MRHAHPARRHRARLGLQIALIASGLVVPTMYFMGAVFAALWWASVHFGRKVDEAKARFAAQAAEASGSAPADAA